MEKSWRKYFGSLDMFCAKMVCIIRVNVDFNYTCKKYQVLVLTVVVQYEILYKTTCNFQQRPNIQRSTCFLTFLYAAHWWYQKDEMCKVTPCVTVMVPLHMIWLTVRLHIHYMVPVSLQNCLKKSPKVSWWFLGCFPKSERAMQRFLFRHRGEYTHCDINVILVISNNLFFKYIIHNACTLSAYRSQGFSINSMKTT